MARTVRLFFYEPLRKIHTSVIDLATPGGTYPLSLQEAESLVAALEEVINDVRRNCLYELDSLQGEKNG